MFTVGVDAGHLLPLLLFAEAVFQHVFVFRL